VAFDTRRFLVRFVEEARKHLKELSSGLIELEHRQDDELLNTIFRCAHTIKGSSTMMDLPEIAEFAHTIENSLMSIRDKKSPVTRELIDTLLEAIDRLSVMIDEAEAGKEIRKPEAALLERIMQTPEQAVQLPITEAAGQDLPAVQPERRKRQRTAAGTFSIRTEKLDDLIRLVSELSIWNRSLEEHLQGIHTAAQLSRSVRESSDRNDMQRLKGLISTLEEHTGNLSSSIMQDMSTLDQLNTELRDTLFDLRMVPIGIILEKFPRVVRSIAEAYHKQIILSITGEETELDKKIIEMIDESLIQIIRNAIDHGIESPEERIGAGKPAEGTIQVHAGYEQGMCRITISDDGRGIDTARLTQKAVEKGMLTTSEAEKIIRRPTSEALIDLIFTAGLSSSSIITDLSGRGVGMDIVHENIIRRLNGQIIVESVPDEGTSFSIMLPLNTAIMQATVFRIGTQELAVPSHALHEVLRVENEQFIDVVNGRAVRLREQIIPLVQLERLLKITGEAAQKQSQLVLIIKTANGFAAVAVDDIITQSSFVIHSLPKHLQHTRWVSGCIITGAYSIVNLLNTRHLVEYAQQADLTGTAAAGNAGEQNIISILVADDSISTRDIEKSILESYGYRVETASDGQEALEMAREKQYDLIITDIEMPRMDGISLTIQLRKERSYAHIPIILVTSRDQQADKIRGAQAGADAYIIKSSFDQENLIQTIRTLV
jgi:two-component system, chemotaxis family, sensor kinase CheA